MRYLSAIVILLSIIIITVLPVVPLAEPEQSICGDVDGDGKIWPSDLVYFDAYMWLDGPAPVDMWTANCGGCAGVNIYDLGRLANSLMAAGPPRQCELDTVCPGESHGSMLLEGVVGSAGPGLIFTGCSPRLRIRLTNDTQWSVYAMANGFRVYSPDGATWNATVLSFTEQFPTDYSAFDRIYVRYFSADGAAADTVGIGAYSLFRGLARWYDEVALDIEIGPIPMASVGKTICLDSCWYPPAGDWLWYHWDVETLPPSIPTWDGPHCFTVEACCEHRGNLTLSGSINISDLTYLVAHLFQGGPGAVCFEVGDINGDLSGPNVSDLTYLVAFLFQGGSPPPGC